MPGAFRVSITSTSRAFSQAYKPTMREVAICPRCYFMGGDGFFFHSGPADNTSLMLSQQLRCHSIYNTRRTTSQSSLLPPVSSCFHFWNLAADQIGFSPAGRALEVEDGAMCHKSILSTRYYHSTSDGLTAAHMAQGGAAPPLSESGRTLFVWLDVGQMMRTRNPGRCDGERRWYL